MNKRKMAYTHIHPTGGQKSISRIFYSRSWCSSIGQQFYVWTILQALNCWANLLPANRHFSSKQKLHFCMKRNFSAARRRRYTQFQFISLSFFLELVVVRHFANKLGEHMHAFMAVIPWRKITWEYLHKSVCRFFLLALLCNSFVMCKNWMMQYYDRFS